LAAALDPGEAADPLAALAAPPRRTVACATLLNLARANVLAETLAALPQAAVAVLAAALGLAPGPQRRNGADAAATPAAGAIDALATLASSWPALAAAARGLALRAHAATRLDLDLDAAPARALANAAAAWLMDSTALRSSRPSADLRGAPPPAVPTDAVAIVTAAPDLEPSAEIDADPLDAAPANEMAAATDLTPGSLVATRCAGLFYLLDRVQELDLAESLWKVCLPEGAVLAAAMAALLGPQFADDAAAALFGGVAVVPTPPEVSAEQHAEVAAFTCAAMAAALQRRALAEIRSVWVTLVEHPRGRLLVAAAEHSPFAFFAWPATTRAELDAGLHALLAAWPHHADLQTIPALASADRSGRLRPRRDLPPPRLLMPAAASAPAAALLALVAGAPCELIAARAGAAAFDTAEAFVARYLARDGRVRIGAERMDVIIGAAAVDFELRRAGLDRDPGWLAWLARTVRFSFEEQQGSRARRAAPQGDA
jgi:hypothetical protein